MIRFGPAGNSDSFYQEGYSSTLDAPMWLKGKGATAFEYSFSRGVHVNDETLVQLGKLFKENDIVVSVHAPYFINLANPDDLMVEKSYGYVIDCLRALRLLGGNRCVFHAGSCGKQPRQEAYALLKERMQELVKRVKDLGYSDMYLCPETMGKSQQIGTYQEIADLCTIDDIVIPTVDFGHINALTQGSLVTEQDYAQVIDYFVQHIGSQKTNMMQVHFSKIEYGPKGELKHLTFEDEKYGPEYTNLAKVFHKYKMNPIVICESKGTQLEDSLIMKNIQEKMN